MNEKNKGNVRFVFESIGENIDHSEIEILFQEFFYNNFITQNDEYEMIQNDLQSRSSEILKQQLNIPEDGTYELIGELFTDSSKTYIQNFRIRKLNTEDQDYFYFNNLIN